MIHRVGRWRMIYWTVCSPFTGMWLALAVSMSLIGRRMWRQHDEWLDWLHEGCCYRGKPLQGAQEGGE